MVSADPRRDRALVFLVTHMNERLNAILKSNTSEYWLRQLEDKRIPCAPVNRFSQALRDSQVLHRQEFIG